MESAFGNETLSIAEIYSTGRFCISNLDSLLPEASVSMVGMIFIKFYLISNLLQNLKHKFEELKKKHNKKINIT